MRVHRMSDYVKMGAVAGADLHRDMYFHFPLRAAAYGMLASQAFVALELWTYMQTYNVSRADPVIVRKHLEEKSCSSALPAFFDIPARYC